MQAVIVKKRNANIELLRIISMIMIIFLHALGKGNLLPNIAISYSVNGTIAWLIEAFSLSAVNIFILISGYFLIDSTFKIKRLVELVCETIFYSLGAFLICFLLGIETGEKISIYFLLHTLLPVHMNLYWFISSYIVIYMFLPLISAGVKSITQMQFRNMLIVLVIYECLFKSLLPVRLSEDEFGYNFLWFLIVFLIGAYFKLYGFALIDCKRKGWTLYILSSILIFAENTALDYVIVNYGRLSELSGVSTEYNHIFVLLASIGIFSAFIHMKEMNAKISKVICFLSPMALGVYLAHENLSLRYNWQKWLHIADTLSYPTWQFLIKLIAAILLVYVLGTLIDYVRIQMFRLIGAFFVKHET